MTIAVIMGYRFTENVGLKSMLNRIYFIFTYIAIKNNFIIPILTNVQAERGGPGHGVGISDPERGGKEGE